MGLGIAGGLLGIVWGALGPYLTDRWPSRFQWGMYGTGIKPVILLVIGLVLGLLGIVGAVAAPKARGVAAVLLIISGLVGLLMGASWLVPGALLLAAAGLAIAGDRG
jgi:MFS family permease